MEMFRTCGYGCEIERVEVEKKTEKSVWVKGSRNAIKSEWHQYHETFESAKAYLLTVAESKLKSARWRVECAESFLEKVKAQTVAVSP